MAEKVINILTSKAKRNQDGSVTITLQSDVIEAWMKEQSEGKTYDNQVAGLTGYKSLLKIDKFLERNVGYGTGWGDFATTYEYGPQLLKCVGLTEGITFTLLRVNHDWSQAHINAFHEKLRDAALKFYNLTLLPVAGELNVTAKIIALDT